MWRMGTLMSRASSKNKIITENNDNSIKGSEDDAVVVLEDYPSAEIGKPIYRMGEKLQVVAHEAYCWRVRSIQTGKENYIPHRHVAKVYHGWLFEGLERQKAEELLLLPGNRMGSFLVRESTSQRGLYSLSVKHQTVMHYRIFRLDNSWYYISPCLTFQCLEDLINHYSDSADGLCCALTIPCLTGSVQPADARSGPLPTLMRRNLDWKKVERKELVSTDSCDNSMVSYGVRSSIAAYLSFSDDQNSVKLNSDIRKKKAKSMLAFNPDTDYIDEF
ncbi:src like adaptor 1a [Gouania willdenowi]|uniref:Src-like-adapter n=1 Tax=Gouania willdenowi TaxID=441366 RepID=A0A8C5HD20_GOUWI|nr:src-like-adapter [Gouania willdenowi]